MVNLLLESKGTTEGNTPFLFYFILCPCLSKPWGLQTAQMGQGTHTAWWLHGWQWMDGREDDRWMVMDLHTYTMANEWWWRTNKARNNTTQIWQHYCTGWTLVYEHNSNQTLNAWINQWHIAVPCSIMLCILTFTALWRELWWLG